MLPFFDGLIYCFLVAFGIVVGASVFAGLGAVINNDPPLKTMVDMASSIKIWAIAAGMGGTFAALEVIEKGLFKGEARSLIKQIVFIAATLWGANLGYKLISLIKRCGDIWSK